MRSARLARRKSSSSATAPITAIRIRAPLRPTSPRHHPASPSRSSRSAFPPPIEGALPASPRRRAGITTTSPIPTASTRRSTKRRSLQFFHPVHRRKPPTAGVNAAPPPPAGASLRASASLAEGGALLDVPVSWQIFKSGDTTALGESQGSDISAKLPAGSYDVEATLGSLYGAAGGHDRSRQRAKHHRAAQRCASRLRAAARKGGEAIADSHSDRRHQATHRSRSLATAPPTSTCRRPPTRVNCLPTASRAPRNQ